LKQNKFTLEMDSDMFVIPMLMAASSVPINHIH